MAFFKEELAKVKGLVFDVDGVLSKTVSPLDENGNPMRTANVKDGFAIVTAVKAGMHIAIITGGNTASVENRYAKLGVEHIYMGAKDKVACLNDFLSKTGITADEVMYMGDDMPDYSIMKEVALPVCPADAIPDIKNISKYVSYFDGGKGCARDVIEQVLRAQNKWVIDETAKGVAF
ncbi:HAD-IIIA family hydrolase [Prolixibacteraceae bacterium JC049]|nr:HAD-IIIA family hydrolase [Prolixibacteraceae bacterium JC049]